MLQDIFKSISDPKSCVFLQMAIGLETFILPIVWYNE